MPDDRVAVVSGPNLAREIMQRQPAATVVACTDETARALQQACADAVLPALHEHRRRRRPSWAAAVKNVIALANGVAAGLGFGENAQASLITRGLAEMTRLGVAMGADPLTFAGLAGLGDLVATCSSPLSRNRTFGVNLGKGMTPEEAARAMRQTCEGVKSCRPILELARAHGVDMPITEAVVAGRARGPRAAGDGARADDPRRQGRAAPADRAGRRESRPRAGARSAHRSSTSSMPTESRSSESLTAALSDGQRRRRSRLDSTPPRLVAWIHRRTAATAGRRRRAPPATSMEIIAPEPG